MSEWDTKPVWVWHNMMKEQAEMLCGLFFSPLPSYFVCVLNRFNTASQCFFTLDWLALGLMGFSSQMNNSVCLKCSFVKVHMLCKINKYNNHGVVLPMCLCERQLICLLVSHQIMRFTREWCDWELTSLMGVKVKLCWNAEKERKINHAHKQAKPGYWCDRGYFDLCFPLSRAQKKLFSNSLSPSAPVSVK